MVAQTVAADLPLAVAHANGAVRLYQLLVVALGELLAGRLVWRVGLAAEHARSALSGERDVGLALGVGVVRECFLRVRHLLGFVEQHHLAGVVDAQFLERRDDGPLQATGVELVVGGDVRTLVHEAHAAAGLAVDGRQVETHRHLGVALVGPVPHAEPSAHLLHRVEAVDVHALVEVGLRAQLVHVFVGRIEANSHGVTVPIVGRVAVTVRYRSVLAGRQGERTEPLGQ